MLNFIATNEKYQGSIYKSGQWTASAKEIFGRVGELLLEAFSASILNIFNSQSLLQCDFTVTGLPHGFPE